MSQELHQRYERQMRLPGFGAAGQRALGSSKVLVVGAGGLGSPVALYLAAAGVGTLGLADPDVVELSNLHRQILHGAESLGTPKVISAAETLGALNPTTRLVLHGSGLTPSNAAELVAAYDLVVDGADNFSTRFLAADACVLGSKPLIHGSILRQSGQVGVFLPGRGCYRCLYPVMPDPGSTPTCGEAGVLGASCGVIGSWMASEALAVLLSQRQASRLLLVDLEAGLTRPVALGPDPGCPACGRDPVLRGIDASAYTISCTSMNPAEHPMEVTVEETDALLKSHPGLVLLDVREADELAVCKMGATHHIPLGELGVRWEELPRDGRILIHCHHGGRSLRATQFLRAKGLKAVSNVKGGIEAWSCRIDPSIRRY
jgi:adenylyltransferase/sulfurtransferase